MSTAASRAPVLAAAAVATSVTAYAFVRTLLYAVPLRVVYGATFGAVAAGLALALLFESSVLARELARLLRGKPRERPLTPLRWLFVVLVLYWLAFLAWLQPFERLWFEMSLSIALGGWAALLAIETPMERLPVRLRRALGVSLFSLCAGAVLLELSLRAIAAFHPSQVFVRASDPGRQGIAQIGQNREEAGALRFGFPCNRGGHYDDEFYRRVPPEHLVVSIGDSFGQGIVPLPFHFTTVCEKELGYPIDSMGIAGVGPPEYLWMLVDEAVPLDPDVVVIDVFVGNDLEFAVPNPGSWRDRARTWFLRENVLLWVIPDRLSKIAEEKRRRGDAGGAVAVVQGIDAPSGAEGTLEQRFPWCFDPMLERPTFSEEAFLEIETKRAVAIARSTPATLAPFHEKMLEMKSAAGSIRLVVMLIPDQFQIEEDVWSDLVARGQVADPERDRAQRLLLPWFAENGIPCLDLLPILRTQAPMADGLRHLYHRRDTHFNARGNRAAGQALAEFLRSLSKKS